MKREEYLTRSRRAYARIGAISLCIIVTLVLPAGLWVGHAEEAETAVNEGLIGKVERLEKELQDLREEIGRLGGRDPLDGLVDLKNFGMTDLVSARIRTADWAPIPTLEVTVETTGRPVMIIVVGGSFPKAERVRSVEGEDNKELAQRDISHLRNGTFIHCHTEASSGRHVYRIQVTGSYGDMGADRVRLVVYEL